MAKVEIENTLEHPYPVGTAVVLKGRFPDRGRVDAVHRSAAYGYWYHCSTHHGTKVVAFANEIEAACD